MKTGRNRVVRGTEGALRARSPLTLARFGLAKPSEPERFGIALETEIKVVGEDVTDKT